MFTLAVAVLSFPTKTPSLDAFKQMFYKDTYLRDQFYPLNRDQVTYSSG